MQRFSIIGCHIHCIELKLLDVKRITLFLALSVVIALFNGCMKNKSCTPAAPSTESTQMLSYAAAHSMNVTAHPSGLYYEILDPGTGQVPDVNSKIIITYVSKTLDGTTIDNQQT